MKKGFITGKGCIAPAPAYAVVVGGVNMDIGGLSHAPLMAADSNPGRVHMSQGGVGRNIAHNLTLLGVDTRMITVLGGDVYAQQIAAACGELGIDITPSLQVPEGRTSTYLFISGPDGDMALALADMDIYAHLTPSFLSTRLSVLNSARLVVIDANIPAESIAWLARHIDVPIFADPVSTGKAEKLRPVLGKLHTLKPNRLEAELLSGVPITGEETLSRAAQAMLDTGLRRVFISLGRDGVYAADRSGRCRLPCCPGKVVNSTGGGDAFMAALAWAYLEGADLRGSALAGTAAASIAVEGRETINPDLSLETIRARMS